MSVIMHVTLDGTPGWVLRRSPEEPGATASGTTTPDGGTDGATDVALPPLAELLAMPLAQARALVEQAAAGAAGAPAAGEVLAPVDEQEVWAAGVTYRRSRDGRMEESDNASVYDLVYEADRPEIFFKSTAGRVVADGDHVGIRTDSGWDVPEPEVGLVVNSDGEIFGYVVGNDMSSRSIEGKNSLYLPQAKMYDRACSLGPGIRPVWELADGPLDVTIRIERDGAPVFEAAGSTSDMKRTFPELVDWLTRAMTFPTGAVLLTGTGLVPDRDFTLNPDDVVVIDVGGVGTLTNPVVHVGR